MPAIELNDVTLNYELTGASSAPILMLSNSLGTNLTLWDLQREPFEKQYRVLRYDMRGHGSSSVPPGPYTLNQLGHDVLALLDALEIEKVHFCGLSVGGLIGQWLGIHAGSRLNKLVLSDTAARIGVTDTWNNRIAEVHQSGLEPIANGVLQRWFTPGFAAAHASLIARMKEMLLATDRAGYTASCAALRDADLRQAIGAIRVPVCIISGDQDPVTTVADAQFIQASIAGTELTILSAAHISNIEAAERYNATVLDFLAKDAPGR